MGNRKRLQTYLIEITCAANGSDFISVVEEANAGLSQAIGLTDMNFAKALLEFLPNVSSQATPRCNSDPVCGLCLCLTGITTRLATSECKRLPIIQLFM